MNDPIIYKGMSVDLTQSDVDRAEEFYSARLDGHEKVKFILCKAFEFARDRSAKIYGPRELHEWEVTTLP